MLSAMFVGFSRALTLSHSHGAECIVDGHLHRLHALAAAVRQAFRERAARGSDAGMGGSANADTSVCAATSADRTFAMDAPVQVIAAPAPLSYLRSVAPLRAALSTPIARIALDVTAWLNVTLLERTFGANLMHVFDHWLGQYLYALLGAAWVFGNALLVRKARVVAVVETDVLLLGKWRVAQRALVVLANARRVWVLVRACATFSLYLHADSWHLELFFVWIASHC
jgi:hypothetical protein